MDRTVAKWAAFGLIAGMFGFGAGDLSAQTQRVKNKGKTVEKDGKININDEEPTSPVLIKQVGKDLSITTKLFKPPTDDWKFKPFGKTHVDIVLPTGATGTAVPDTQAEIKVLASGIPLNAAQFPLRAEGNLSPPRKGGKGGGQTTPPLWHWSVKADKATIEILDSAKKSTEKLKVAKWENGFQGNNPPKVKPNFPDMDVDRFYVRVTDFSKKGAGKVTASVSTNSPGTAYDDKASEIELIETGAGTGVFLSKSQVLMSDTVDDAYKIDGIADEAKNDRSHIIALKGVVTAEYPFSGEVLKDEATVPVEKTLTVPVFILRDKKKAAGGKPVIAEASVKKDFVVANERYAQIGLLVTASPIKVVDPPAGVNLADGSLDEFARHPNLTAEEKALLNGLGTKTTNDILVFYVNRLSRGSAGETIAAKVFFGAVVHPAKWENNLILGANRRIFTLPHELVHAMLDEGNHDPRKFMLMRGGTSAVNGVAESKRLPKNKETAIHASKFVK